MTFHTLTLSDRDAMQAVTLHTGRRNCNYTFANLIGWQFRYSTEICTLPDTVVLRYTFDGRQAYMVCTSGPLSLELIQALYDDSNHDLTLIGLEDTQVGQLSTSCPQFSFSIKPVRNQYDYIYRRTQLATLHGRHLNAKRNHIHRFRAEHPDFEYRPLTPELFDECRRLTEIWQEQKDASDTIAIERQVMENILSNWDTLNMTGGSIFIDNHMVAFTYGTAVTTDTLDVCAEKANRHIEGSFAIINQQFAEHLPEQYIYLNREEDMGIPGLRQAKLSYHPEILLTYNVVHITKNDRR
ncbi:MAG: DUF2156 domain-containing protein [Bacteroidaceae bacterium]|nr:DUF2156 domain-containing protein [Bacteroidaceae bacterium]